MEFNLNKFMDDYNRTLTIGDVAQVKNKGYFLVKDEKGFNLKKKKGDVEKKHPAFNSKVEAYKFARRLLEQKDRWE